MCEFMAKQDLMSESETSTLLHGLLVLSKSDTGLRMGLENDLVFSRVLCLLTDSGRRVRGSEPGRLLSLVSQIVSATKETECAAICLLMAENLIAQCPRLRGKPLVQKLFDACVIVIERGTSSLCAQLAVDVLQILPLSRIFVHISDKLARTLCTALTMTPAASQDVRHDGLARKATELCRTLLASPTRHIFFSSIAKVAKTKPNSKEEVKLVRGAVYLIGMALWSHQRVQIFVNETPLSAAISILRAAAGCGDDSVIMEVSLSTRRLVKKYGATLDIEWDSILALFDELLPSAEKFPPLKDAALELTALYLQTTPELLENPSSEL